MRVTLGVLIVLFAASFNLLADEPQSYQRISEVIYGHAYGTSLSLDVFKPEKPNGAGIIFIVSGGWFSSREAIAPHVYEPFLNRGYTVFAVVHGSQPKFTISEIIPQVNRAVRFIRHNAATYGIDPQKLGVIGGSAGGHLSLAIGTGMGNQPKADAKDPIDRESSAVACVACFFPPTDFLNYGGAGQEAQGIGTLKEYRPAFGNIPEDPDKRKELGHRLSPIYFITTNLPPTLIIHGDADQLVPLQQSETFRAKAVALGDNVKLIVKPGEGHGWPDWVTVDLRACADWFDEYLRGIKPAKDSPLSTN